MKKSFLFSACAIFVCGLSVHSAAQETPQPLKRPLAPVVAELTPRASGNVLSVRTTNGNGKRWSVIFLDADGNEVNAHSCNPSTGDWDDPATPTLHYDLLLKALIHDLRAEVSVSEPPAHNRKCVGSVRIYAK